MDLSRRHSPSMPVAAPRSGAAAPFARALVLLVVATSAAGAQQPATAAALRRAEAASGEAIQALEQAANAWLDHADACRGEGDHAAAIASVERAMTLVGNASPVLAAGLRANLGAFLLEAGHATRAVRELEAALAALEAEGSPAQAVECRVNLAAALVDTGELARAHALQRQVLEERGGSLDAYGRYVLLRNIADIERSLGQSAAALRHADEGLAALRGAEDLDERAKELAVQLALADRAVILFAIGHAAGDAAMTRAAEEDLRAAAATIDAGDLLPPSHVARLVIDQRLGHVLWRRGAVAEALALSAGVVERTRQGQSLEPSARVTILFGHASLLASSGRFAEARAYMRQAVDVARARLQSVDAASDRALAFLYHHLRDVLSSQLSCRDGVADDPELAREDVACWLLGRGLAVERWRRARSVSERAARDGDFAHELREVRLLAARAAAAAPDDAASLRVEVDRRQAALTALLDAAVGDAADLDALCGLLPDDATAVVTATYVRYRPAQEGQPTSDGTEHVAAFLLRRDGSARRFDLGPAADLAAEVQAARASWQSGAGALRGIEPEQEPAARDPYALQRRLQPLLAAIAPDVARLVVCPDGALAAVPWAALAFADGTLLQDRWTIGYVDHLAALRVGRVAAGPPSSLVLADVDYGVPTASAAAGWDREPRPAWRPLPGTRLDLEVCRRTFASAFPGATRTELIGADATKARLAGMLAQHRFLHLATHAFVDDRRLDAPAAAPFAALTMAGARDPQDLVGLVLAGANRGEPDGVLTAAELAAMDLGRCELAFLATCSANQGPRAFGDATAGLHAAVRAAGARAVVSTLWPIPDAEAASFCEAFYTALWNEGARPVQAFRAAQQRTRAAGLPPRCWAAFVYYGPVE